MFFAFSNAPFSFYSLSKTLNFKKCSNLCKVKSILFSFYKYDKIHTLNT